MKPVVYATIAVILFSIMNVGLEQKLAKYNSAALMLCFYAVMVPMAFVRVGLLRSSEGSVLFPSGTMLLLTFVIGIIYFAADFSYISAFTAAGGSVMAVSTVLVTVPAFSSLIKYVYTGGGLPNVYQVAGYIMAIAAVLLNSKGGN